MAGQAGWDWPAAEAERQANQALVQRASREANEHPIQDERTAQGDRLAMIVFIAVLVALGLLAWWLLFRPPP